MAIIRRGDCYYAYFFPFPGLPKVGLKLDCSTKTEAKAMQAVIQRACRSGDFSGLNPAEREAVIRMYSNQSWQLPECLAPAIVQPQETLTLWKSAQLCLTYPGVKDSSNRGRHEQAFTHIVDYFGEDMPVRELWAPQIREYLVFRLAEKAAGSTINKERAALSRMFQVLLELRLVDVNPVKLVERVSEKDGERQVYVSYSDMQRILDHLPAWFRPVAQTAYYTGMRRGEILGLTRDRLKLDRRLILLGMGDTKERQQKRVPIHRELAPVLEAVLKVQALGTDHVFLRDGKPITDRNNLRWAWEYPVSKIEDLSPAPRFHDLRHTWKTNARRSGMHPEIEKAIMGHSSRGRSIHERYGAISDVELLKAIDGMTFDNGPTEIWVAEREKAKDKTGSRKMKSMATKWQQVESRCPVSKR